MMKVEQKLTSLPLTHQVALWAILRMEGASKQNFSFLTSQFIKVFQDYVKKYISEQPQEYEKFVGAILSGLARNKILVKLTGDRDKLWTLSDEIKTEFEEYKNFLFKVEAYWR